jgi:streptogramin lyase
MRNALNALSGAVTLIGCAAAIVLASCSASHTANPSSVFPGAPSFTSQDGFNPFNLKAKNIIHTYPTGTTPNFMATGSDKNVWFTEDNVARIGKITSDGIISEYTIPSGNLAKDIAPGAAGTLWFTESSAIGKVTIAGNITEYVLPSGCGQGLSKGPDGNMWFTDPCSNAIGKITRSGTVTEYSIPTASANPYDIVTGPDGNLWFVEFGGGKVGKISTAGALAEYTPPTPDNPLYIAAGPDGNLYASSNNYISRITTAGVITQYNPNDGSGHDDIILGPDKQMWVTYSFACSGGIEEFNPKTLAFDANLYLGNVCPLGLTVGGDGDVWIADSAGDVLVYEEKITTIGIRLNGELSFMDPNYGFELGYAVGTSSTQTQTISLGTGESVQFKNVDTIPHSAAFLGNATANSAPWPPSFTGSTTKSPAGTAIGTAGWATGSLNANKTSPIYETGLPGFYMIGDQYDYVSNNMRTVIVVH